MSTSLSAFTPRIAHRAAGCPDFVIEQAVLDACIEFAESTHVVVTTTDPMITFAGTPEIDVDINPTERVVNIQGVWVDGTEIFPVDRDGARASSLFSEGDGTTQTDAKPRRYIHANGVLRLWPTPDKQYTVIARVATKPSRVATTVDDAYFEDWVSAVVDGAMYRLLAQPASWGNEKLAAFHKARFDSACQDAMVRATNGGNHYIGDDRIRGERV